MHSLARQFEGTAASVLVLGGKELRETTKANTVWCQDTKQMACVLAHLTQCPNPLEQLLIYSFNHSTLCLALPLSTGGLRKGLVVNWVRRGGRDDFDLDLNSDLESSFP